MTEIVDPLDDALEDLRITGSVLLHKAFSPPWSIAIPDEARLQSLLKVPAGARVVPFHLVRRSHFELTMGSRRRLSVASSEVVLCPGGAAHRLSRGARVKTLQFEDMLLGRAKLPPSRPNPDATELICGIFVIQASALNPLVSALPPVLKVGLTGTGMNRVLGAAGDLLAALLELGPGRRHAISRLLEVFCGEAIRVYQLTQGLESRGWFRGLADPRIAAALRAIHASPDRDWTVALLARTASLSASRFAARFRDTTGFTVMNYLMRWRANIACRLLRESDLPVSDIGARVGYSNGPSFNRAFREMTGDSPGRWRTRFAARQSAAE